MQLHLYIKIHSYQAFIFGIENDVVFDPKIYIENKLNDPLVKEIPFVENVLATGIKI
ncbi:MAG: hypothetical protein ACYDIA_15870 [Candidatus Humimicrobiaceae bacterium]